MLRKLDHGAIFLLIAGTYTPFTLGALNGPLGWTLFGVVWSLAVIGVTLKAFDRIEHPVASLGLYLFMGWLCVVAIEPLLQRIPLPGLLLLGAGGLSYMAGVAFFTVDSRVRYGHFIWHLFVLARHRLPLLRRARATPRHHGSESRSWRRDPRCRLVLGRAFGQGGTVERVDARRKGIDPACRCGDLVAASIALRAAVVASETSSLT